MCVCRLVHQYSSGFSLDCHRDYALLVLHDGDGDRVDDVLGSIDEYGRAKAYLKGSRADDPSLLKAGILQIRILSIVEVSPKMWPLYIRLGRDTVLVRTGSPPPRAVFIDDALQSHYKYISTIILFLRLLSRHRIDTPLLSQPAIPIRLSYLHVRNRRISGPEITVLPQLLYRVVASRITTEE